MVSRPPREARVLAAFLLASALTGLGVPVVSLAATINVNSTADTLVVGDGKCTLREAIDNANGDADTSGDDCAPGSGPETVSRRATPELRRMPMHNRRLEGHSGPGIWMLASGALALASFATPARAVVPDPS